MEAPECTLIPADFSDVIPEELRRHLTKTFLERVKRLEKWLLLKAPGPILCGEVKLILEIAFILYPESMGGAFSGMVRDQALAKLGICRDCYGEREIPDLCCTKCEAEFAAEMEREGWGDAPDGPLRLWVYREGAEVELEEEYPSLAEAARSALTLFDVEPVSRITGPDFDWRPRPDTVREELEEIVREGGGAAQ
jgi:hypothetical protein